MNRFLDGLVGLLTGLGIALVVCSVVLVPSNQVLGNSPDIPPACTGGDPCGTNGCTNQSNQNCVNKKCMAFGCGCSNPGGPGCRGCACDFGADNKCHCIPG
jgi:hypothetical protein